MGEGAFVKSWQASLRNVKQRRRPARLSQGKGFGRKRGGKAPTTALPCRRDLTAPLQRKGRWRAVFESLSSGLISQAGIAWLLSQQGRCSTPERAAMQRLGRLPDEGRILLECLGHRKGSNAARR